nr:hypothetical protein [Burkholderia pseudomallei]
MPLLNREENSSRKRTSISKNNRKFFRRNAAFFPACFSESIVSIDNQKIGRLPPEPYAAR